MMKLAEVYTLYETNARSIPDMLRQAADRIESETDEDARTTAIVAVQLSEGGQINVYGWGDTTDVHAIGVLQMGIMEIAQMTRGGD